MARTSMKEKRSTFCSDCIKDKESCGEDPLICRQSDGASIYFKFYDTKNVKRGVRVAR